MKRSQPARVPGCAARLLVATVLAAIGAGPGDPPGAPRAVPEAAVRSRADAHGDPLPPGVAARFGTIRHRQEAPIWRIVYSPDGRFLATEGDDAEVRIWDARDGRLVRRIDVGPALIRMPAFSPDSRTLVVASYRLDRDRLGYVVDATHAEVASGTRIVRGPWPEQDSVRALGLSTDRGLLATGTSGGTLRLRDAQDGREAGRFLVDRREIRAIAFDRSGDRVAALSGDAFDRHAEVRVDVFDVRKKEVVRVIPGLRSGTRLTLSPDGNRVFVCDRFMIHGRDVGSGQPVELGQLWGEDAAFSADGRLVVDFHWPGVHVNDTATGQVLASFESSGSHPNAWALSPDGTTVAATGGPMTLRLWEIATGRDRLAVADAHAEPVRLVRFTPDGRTLITGGEDRTVRLWDAASGAQRKVLQLAGKPRALALSADARLLTVGAEDNGWVFTWELANPDKPAILVERYKSEGFPLDVRHSAADGPIAVAWSDGRLLEGDVKGGKLRDRKPPRFAQGDEIERMIANRFRSAVSFGGGSRLAAIRRDKGLRVVDLASGRQLWEYADATLVAPSPDGKTLAVALQVDDPYYQERSFSVEGPDRPASRRPPRIGPAPPGATVVLLDGESGRERLRVPIPEPIAWDLAFSPDGQTLAASGGGDGTRARIRLIRTANGGVARVITTPAIGGPGLAFSPDGTRLAAAMADTSVLLWDLRPGP